MKCAAKTVSAREDSPRPHVCFAWRATAAVRKRARQNAALLLSISLDTYRGLTGPVMSVDPELTMVMPPPMAGVPTPAHSVIVIPPPVVVISAIADIDRNSDRLRPHRSKCARAKKRGQQNSKFVFHNVFLIVVRLILPGYYSRSFH